MRIFFSTSVFILWLVSCSSDDKVITYHDNGEVKEKYQYVNDEVDGIYLAYHSNGYIATIAEYHQGKKIGSHKFYSESDSGQIVQELMYVQDPPNTNQEFIGIKKYSNDTLTLEHKKRSLDLQVTVESDTVKITIKDGIYPYYRAIVGDITKENGMMSNDVIHYQSKNNLINIPLNHNGLTPDYIQGQIINFDIVPFQDSVFIGMIGYEKGDFNYFKINVRDSLNEL